MVIICKASGLRRQSSRTSWQFGNFAYAILDLEAEVEKLLYSMEVTNHVEELWKLCQFDENVVWWIWSRLGLLQMELCSNQA